MGEAIEDRRKRMRIRAWRRGTKEMDLILGGYADAHLAGMDAAALDAFDALLAEDDHDLYQWVTGQAAPPGRFAVLVAELTARTAG
ncbi:succinate dehydrogenase assembly factor 2 [Rhodovulum euryhalinum]|uniref:FAD assembly factor SdhE n=1 Tax=Rhodovulum euryhalinum TaxID=35805 RepID=A0A4R2K8A6_9RHOB|nr:succinate dehydrogenase assembly factor 2 [Rhodovulum euryhalinum]TCO68312.1 antitoxin CptB [Rhodovulum euryhalinum]